MYAPERHRAILDTARDAGRVEVKSLARLFDVTPETIRRDVTALESRGLLLRAHGGAIPIERSTIGRGAFGHPTSVPPKSHVKNVTSAVSTMMITDAIQPATGTPETAAATASAIATPAGIAELT